MTERVIEVVKNFEKVTKPQSQLTDRHFSNNAFFSTFIQVDGSKVTATARFKDDLDLDSLDAVEIVMAIEEEFNIVR